MGYSIAFCNRISLFPEAADNLSSLLSPLSGISFGQPKVEKGLLHILYALVKG